MSDSSEAFHNCLFVSRGASGDTEVDTKVLLDGRWDICARPSELCLGALQRLENKIAAIKRLRQLAELCGNEVFDLSHLRPDDILHLYATKPPLGYGQTSGRVLSVQVRTLEVLRDPADHRMATIRTARGTVVQDTYNSLPASHPNYKLAVPTGSDIRVLGRWKESAPSGKADAGTEDKSKRNESAAKMVPGQGEAPAGRLEYGMLVVGSLATYEFSRGGKPRTHALMLQEVAVTDPAGVQAVLWDTDPMAYREAADFLNASWSGIQEAN
jgi:hypothetical protein